MNDKEMKEKILKRLDDLAQKSFELFERKSEAERPRWLAFLNGISAARVEVESIFTDAEIV